MSFPKMMLLGYGVNLALMVGGIFAVFYAPLPNGLVAVLSLSLMLCWVPIWVTLAKDAT